MQSHLDGKEHQMTDNWLVVWHHMLSGKAIVGGEAGNSDQCQPFKDLSPCPEAIWILSSRHGKLLRFLRNGDMSSKLHFRKRYSHEKREKAEISGGRECGSVKTLLLMLKGW